MGNEALPEEVPAVRMRAGNETLQATSSANPMQGSTLQDETLKLGLLMEAAHAQQTLAESTLERLKVHVEGLDDIVRDEIRRTLVDEIQVLGRESGQAAEALRRLGRAANARMAVWTIGLTLVCSALPLAAQWWFLPSQTELIELRAKKDELTSAITRLERQGGRIDLRRCGGTERLCVRVDRGAPVYGETGEYFVVKGY